jgi:hypothetical protein
MPDLDTHGRTGLPSRRSLVAAAAWSAPIILASASTPAYASSRTPAISLRVAANEPTIAAGGSSTLVQATLLRDGLPWQGETLMLVLVAPSGVSLSATTGSTNANGVLRSNLSASASAQAGTAYIEARTLDGLQVASTTVDVTAARVAREVLVSVGSATNHSFYGVGSSSGLLRTVRTSNPYRQFTYNESGTEAYSTTSGHTSLYVLDGDTLEVKRTVPLALPGGVSSLSAVIYSWSFTRDGRILAAGNGAGSRWGYYLIDPATGRMESAGFGNSSENYISACEVSPGRYLSMVQSPTALSVSNLSFYGSGGGSPSPDRRVAILEGASLQRCGEDNYYINRGEIHRVDVSGNDVSFVKIATTSGVQAYWGQGAIR